jgi:sugar O-acyltransferase (sialic acid O-acetyltransferase NeuD family)
VSQPLVVIGGGGMGRCVLDLLFVLNSELDHTAPPFEVVGVLDDGQVDVDLLALWEAKHLGPVSRLETQPKDVGYVIGISAGSVRRRVDAFGRSQRRQCPTLVHPNVHRGQGVQIGPGSVVCSHVSMENNIAVGRHVHINQNSTVGHDSRLADYVTISPLVALSGNTKAHEGAFVGTGASVRQGLALGADSTVGMAAAVIRDVPPGSTVVGVPAR